MSAVSIVKINQQTGVFLLRDCGSTCGTFLEDGTPVSAEKYAVLQSGDSFYVGREDIRITLMFDNK